MKARKSKGRRGKGKGREAEEKQEKRDESGKEKEEERKGNEEEVRLLRVATRSSAQSAPTVVTSTSCSARTFFRNRLQFVAHNIREQCSLFTPS